jgi:predicted RNase H-like nuclease (RuvC/YqgF family)
MTDAYTDARRSYSKLAWRAEAIRLHAVNLQLEKETIEANKKAADWIRTSNEADMRHLGEYELLRRERVAETARADAAEATLKAVGIEIANLRAEVRRYTDEAEALRQTMAAIGAEAQGAAQRRFDP